MRSRALLALLPFVLVAVIYRSMGHVPHWGLEPWRVHVCDVRALEIAWFGFGSSTTVHDWLQAHARIGLDVFCAVPYATYLAAAAVYAMWLAHVDRIPSPSRRSLAARFGWGFLALNLAGFITYHVYPAAPPWYYHAHGCSVDVAAAASAGPNLTRVDGLLGFPLFTRLYSQSSWVFGAVPSLHVAYPLLMLATGWPIHGSAARAALGFYWLWMCFAAVYLDHHWIFDVVLGSVYALVVSGAAFTLSRMAWRRAVPERSTP